MQVTKPPLPTVQEVLKSAEQKAAAIVTAARQQAKIIKHAAACQRCTCGKQGQIQGR